MTRVSRMLAGIAVVLAAAVSAAGLGWPALYAADALWVSTQVRGNDLVTLAIAVPVLGVALLMDARGSVRARLVALGMLVYLFYGYAFYLFGVALNVAFLAYVAITAIALLVFVFEIHRLDVRAVAARFGAHAPMRVTAVYLLLIAAFLGLMWTARVVGFMLTGEVPADIVNSQVGSAVVYAMDLTFLVPALVVSGVLILRRSPWGAVLGILLLAKATAYPLALVGMGIFSARAGVESDYYLMLFWVAFALASAGVFWKMLRAIEERGS